MKDHDITRLIDALEQVAAHPPRKPYDERLLHLEVDPVSAEKLVVPFKSIEEWTGFDKRFFPQWTQVSGNQCEQINKTILRVYESLNLRIVDIPDEVNPLVMYVILTINWECQFQYLLLSETKLRLFNDSDEEMYLRSMSGIFNDDGTKVDIDSIQLPSLCIICRQHLSDDQEENILCLLNRNSQQVGEDFECGMFENCI
jgi:hypothetical protein